MAAAPSRCTSTRCRSTPARSTSPSTDATSTYRSDTRAGSASSAQGSRPKRSEFELRARGQMRAEVLYEDRQVVRPDIVVAVQIRRSPEARLTDPCVPGARDPIEIGAIDEAVSVELRRPDDRQGPRAETGSEIGVRHRQSARTQPGHGIHANDRLESRGVDPCRRSDGNVGAE